MMLMLQLAFAAVPIILSIPFTPMIFLPLPSLFVFVPPLLAVSPFLIFLPRLLVVLHLPLLEEVSLRRRSRPLRPRLRPRPHPRLVLA